MELKAVKIQEEYKCRRCGGIEIVKRDVVPPFKYSSPHDVMAYRTVRFFNDGRDFGVSVSHKCSDGGYGAVDFIGAIGIKRKRRHNNSTPEPPGR